MLRLSLLALIPIAAATAPARADCDLRFAPPEAQAALEAFHRSRLQGIATAGRAGSAHGAAHRVR